MNNETNPDAEALQSQFLNWLFQPPMTPASLPDEDPINSTTQSDGLATGAAFPGESWEWDEPDPLDSDTIDVPHPENQPLILGEIPTVQDRFQTVLKVRLKAEIERNPPLFPWETELRDYDPDYRDGFITEWVPPLHLWTAQRHNLKWGLFPIPVTETIFAQLLEPCQQVALSELKEGAKMVRVVEALFPGRKPLLNDLAGKVLMGATRDGFDPRYFPSSYDGATPDQQMVLSLLAAREILGCLTLKCPVNQPPIQRQWLTALGLLTVEAEYQRFGDQPVGRLTIRGELPGGGSLELKGCNTPAVTQRCDAGVLTLELLESPPNQTYPLKVCFQNLEQKPLNFVICPTEMS